MDKDLRKEELNKIKEQKKDEKIKAVYFRGTVSNAYPY